MLDVLLWLLAVEAIGLAAFPLCYYLFPRLRDRGYCVSKPLGILVIGYLSWILSVLHILPSAQVTLVALLIVLGCFSGWYVWGRRQEFLDFLVRERTAILVGEGIFLAMFVGWLIYRAYDPSIDHTEQPMDFAFLNASIRSFLGSPEDPWLRGETVSYYYFGYWMMGMISKLSGVLSNVSYNLSLALIPAMSAMGVFGLVYSLVRDEAGRLRYAVIGGVAAALLLVVAANLEGVPEFMRANGMGSDGVWDWMELKRDPTDPSSELLSRLEAPDLAQGWHPVENWWWFRATRVIDTYDGSRWTDMTIHEFPSFSFILGDLHPHVMSIPFVVLFLAFCWNFLKSPAHVWLPFNRRSYATVLMIGLSLGGLAFTNMWDLPVFGALFVGIAALKAYSAGGAKTWDLVKGAVPIGLVVLGLVFVFFLPYFLTFTSQVSGIGALTQTRTRPFHMFIVWGVFLVAVVPFILGVFWRTTVRKDWARLTVTAMVVGFLPYVVWTFFYMEKGGDPSELVARFAHVLPFALLISIAVYSAMWLARQDKPSTGRVFALALAALGLLLIMGPEMLFVDDSFSGAWERMNTVFKLYYQSWIVLAAASGFAIYYWSTLRESASGFALLLTRVWSVAFVVLLIASAYYPLAAAASKGNLFHEGATLDGLSYLERFDGAEYRAIEFLKEYARRDSAVLEAVGGDYSAFGRISAATGVPTVLGWPGHQRQWRGSSDPFEGREQDVATIYKTRDAQEAKDLLARYDVDYVYVGTREREKYGEDGLSKFSSFMGVVFNEGAVTLYRMLP